MDKAIKCISLTVFILFKPLATAQPVDDPTDKNLEAGVKWFLASESCKNSVPHLLSKAQVYQRMSDSFQSVTDIRTNNAERLVDYILETYEKQLATVDKKALADVRNMDNGSTASIKYCQNRHLEISQEFRRTLRKSVDSLK